MSLLGTYDTMSYRRIQEEQERERQKRMMAMRGASPYMLDTKMEDQIMMRPSQPSPMMPPQQPKQQASETAQQMPSFNPLPQKAGEPFITAKQSESKMPQQSKGLFDKIGNYFDENPDMKDKLTIALQGMTVSPNQGLMDIAKGNIAQRRKKALTERQNNATVQYLRDSGYEREAEIVARNPMMAQAVLSEVAARRKGAIDAQNTLQKEQVKSVAEARNQLPQAQRAVKQAMSAADQVLSIPNDELDEVLGGIDSRLPTFKAESAKIESMLDKLESQAFVAAFESLKGAGQITEFESQTAAAALAAFNRVMSPEDYKDAVRNAKNVFQNIYDSVTQRAGVKGESFVTDDPVSSEYAGYRIKGVK